MMSQLNHMVSSCTRAVGRPCCSRFSKASISRSFFSIFLASLSSLSLSAMEHGFTGCTSFTGGLSVVSGDGMVTVVDIEATLEVSSISLLVISGIHEVRGRTKRFSQRNHYLGISWGCNDVTIKSHGIHDGQFRTSCTRAVGRPCCSRFSKASISRSFFSIFLASLSSLSLSAMEDGFTGSQRNHYLGYLGGAMMSQLNHMVSSCTRAVGRPCCSRFSKASISRVSSTSFTGGLGVVSGDGMVTVVDIEATLEVSSISLAALAFCCFLAIHSRFFAQVLSLWPTPWQKLHCFMIDVAIACCFGKHPLLQSVWNVGERSRSRTFWQKSRGEIISNASVWLGLMHKITKSP